MPACTIAVLSGFSDVGVQRFPRRQAAPPLYAALASAPSTLLRMTLALMFSAS